MYLFYFLNIIDCLRFLIRFVYVEKIENTISFQRAKKVFDPSDNNLVKRKRGRQPGSQNKSSIPQESQDSSKTTVKDGPCRQCSLCAKEKQETLVACRDCTVRGIIVFENMINVLN